MEMRRLLTDRFCKHVADKHANLPGACPSAGSPTGSGAGGKVLRPSASLSALPAALMVCLAPSARSHEQRKTWRPARSEAAENCHAALSAGCRAHAENLLLQNMEREGFGFGFQGGSLEPPRADSCGEGASTLNPCQGACCHRINIDVSYGTNA